MPMSNPVTKDAGLGGGSRYVKWGGVQRNLSEEEALYEVVQKVWQLHFDYGHHVREDDVVLLA